MSSSSDKKRDWTGMTGLQDIDWTNPDTPSKDKSNRPVYRHERFMRSKKFRRRLADAVHPTKLWEKEFHAGLEKYQNALDKQFKTMFIHKFGLISDSDRYMINFIIKELLKSVSHDNIRKLKEVKEYMESDVRGATKVNFILVSMGPIMERHIKRAKKMPAVLKAQAKKGTGKDAEVEYLKMRGKQEALKLYDSEKGLRKMTGRVKSPIDMAGAPGLDESIDSDKFDKDMFNRRGGRRKKKYTKRKRRRRRTKKRRKKRNLKKRTRRRRRKRRR